MNPKQPPVPVSGQQLPEPFNGHSRGRARVAKDGITVCVRDKFGSNPVCKASEVFMSRKEREDNAEFIVECWNTYYTREADRQALSQQVELLRGAGKDMRDYLDKLVQVWPDDAEPAVAALLNAMTDRWDALSALDPDQHHEKG